MEVLTQKTNRRSTRVRVEIPVMVTSLDRMRPFAEKCIALVVSCHGCGFRSSHPLPLGTPVLLSNLPGGGSVTARVANCLPLGADGKHFLIGVALYTHGNVWKVPNPPRNWESNSESEADSSASTWPYSRFPGSTASNAGRK